MCARRLAEARGESSPAPDSGVPATAPVISHGEGCVCKGRLSKQVCLSKREQNSGVQRTAGEEAADCSPSHGTAQVIVGGDLGGVLGGDLGVDLGGDQWKDECFICDDG